MPYDVLLFDADETLFDFKRSERIALEKTLEEFGFPFEEAYHLPLYHRINHGVWKEFEEGRISQAVLKVERFRRLAHALESTFLPADFAKAYMNHLATQSHPYAESATLLQDLGKSRRRMAIITNGLKEVQSRRIRGSILAPHFEEIVISDELGIAKPDPRIFLLTLKRMEHQDLSTVLMIGDSLTSDILGGRNAGIDTCWLNWGGTRNHTGILPTYEIHTLTDLPGLLAQDF